MADKRERARAELIELAGKTMTHLESEPKPGSSTDVTNAYLLGAKIIADKHGIPREELADFSAKAMLLAAQKHNKERYGFIGTMKQHGLFGGIYIYFLTKLIALVSPKGSS